MKTHIGRATATAFVCLCTSTQRTHFFYLNL